MIGFGIWVNGRSIIRIIENILKEFSYLRFSSNKSLWRSFGSPSLLLSSLSRMTWGERKLSPRLVAPLVLVMGESVMDVSGVWPNISLELSRPGEGVSWLLPFLLKKKLAMMNNLRLNSMHSALTGNLNDTDLKEKRYE